MTGQTRNAEPIAILREICLALPEATERPFGGHSSPAFRVRDKMFLVVSEDGETLTCKAPPGEQQLLIASNPRSYFVPKYVGSKGWVGARIDVDTDWEEVAELAEESYRLIAPKRLVALLDSQAQGAGPPEGGPA
jgi:predicted DNA-binding protein (MmcQ/YjbR family)